ncbi:MAG: amino acid ABC transporter permease [Proteobacteria bacterium]|nr:MAG: amino acid ABC transporter permease [Pseudomonadota bacterium]
MAVVTGIALVIGILATNVMANLQRLGVKTGFGFLERPAGFDISQTLITYGEQSTYLTAFVVALLNTLLVFALAALLATVLGFFIGMGRLSGNGVVAAAAGLYVETFRNIPVLIQLLFWYFAVLRPLPGPRQSLSVGDVVFLNNRGLFLPSLHMGDGAELLIVATTSTLLAMVGVLLAARRRRIQSGKRPAWAWCAALPIIGLIATAWLAPAGAIAWQVPHLMGFNFSGGVAVTPELFALTLGLSIYSAAYIAEIVRSGVQAIPRGQIEAARTLGLSPWQIACMIEVPLALRIIVAPLGAYYVILLKNTSLGSAIAYPDLMHVFAGTVLNQTGQPLEVMLITLATYLGLGLVVSGMTNAVNRWLSR